MQGMLASPTHSWAAQEEGHGSGCEAASVASHSWCRRCRREREAAGQGPADALAGRAAWPDLTPGCIVCASIPPAGIRARHGRHHTGVGAGSWADDPPPRAPCLTCSCLETRQHRERRQGERRRTAQAGMLFWGAQVFHRPTASASPGARARCGRHRVQRASHHMAAGAARASLKPLRSAAPAYLASCKAPSAASAKPGCQPFPAPFHPGTAWSFCDICKGALAPRAQWRRRAGQREDGATRGDGQGDWAAQARMGK
jgi:hypothetical protein